MKNNSYQKYAYVLVVLFIFIGVFLFIKKGQAPVSDSSSTYQELIKAGHEFYLKEEYAEALSYFKKAASIEQNDRIYRSLYSAYLGLKDYENAEIMIKKTVDGINKGIPNNWVEYASFENYYLKAPFNVVSQIYLDGLKATKDDINLITSYAQYLAENKKYNEAISYLEKAITIDPERKDTFQAEIEYLRAR